MFDVEETLGNAVSAACHRELNVSIAADLFGEGNMHMHRNRVAARTGRMNRHLRAALAGVAMALLLLPCSLAAEPRWRQAQPTPQGANEVIGAQVGDALLVYGGQSQGGEPMGIFWMYEPSADKWTQLPSNPVPVHHAADVGIGDKFYLFGGFVYRAK